MSTSAASQRWLLEATADRLRSLDVPDLARSCTEAATRRDHAGDDVARLVDARTFHLEVAGSSVRCRVHWQARFRRAGSRIAIEITSADLDRLDVAIADARASSTSIEAFVIRTTQEAGVPLRLEDPAAARQIADTLAQ